ncbi:hypothetical protein Rhopal_006122-T1 [Rhodotorula paludigena]|uniref:Thioesterase domain-containing protein n=1 Tax=Rhodotorula paludigena TaxID=86838 RepID=A0AAV5GU98_9BASI|nr:hypothetical protein Rhopal_006122-T1 [Rhodotorula paludigena]
MPASTRLAAVQQHLSPAPLAAAPHRSASTKASRPAAPSASDFRYFVPFQTRWNDNDQYGHLNNVVYGLYFDSITNHFLLHHALPSSSSPSSKPPLGLIVSSNTTYAASLAYPQPVIAALAISRLSERSLTWRVALFAGEYAPAAESGDRGELSGFELEDLCGGEQAGQEAAQGFEAGANTGARGAGVGRRVRLARSGSGKDEARAAAWGEMVHVFVDAETRRPVERLDEGVRRALERLVVAGTGEEP